MRIINIIYWIELYLPIFISIAFITISERKILGSIQRRQGPKRVGVKGILQSISDGLKLLLKENILPLESRKLFYILSPFIALTITLLLWLILPFKSTIYVLNDNLSIMLFYAISTINIYSLLFSGWSSNSKYGLIGSIRAISQLLSYEITIGIILLIIFILNNSFNFYTVMINQIYCGNWLLLFPIVIIFIIIILAETLRSPFDIVESESELVAGNLVEYSGFFFGSLYLAEYSNILLLSSLTSILFFGLPIISITTFIIIFLFIWIRGSLPRLKWNNLLLLCWTQLLPFILCYLLFIVSLLI